MALAQQQYAHVAFDTLRYAKKLKEVGFTEQQAEVQAECIKDIIDDKLATKQDLKELEVNLKRDIKEQETSLTRDIKHLEERIAASEERTNERIASMGYKITMRLGSIMVAGITVLGLLMHLH